MGPLGERIKEQLKGTSAQKWMDRSFLLSSLGVGEKELDFELDALFAGRVINRAVITRGDVRIEAVWETGYVAPASSEIYRNGTWNITGVPGWLKTESKEKTTMTQAAPEKPVEGSMSTQQQVLETIRKEPGITREEIIKRFPKEKHQAVRSALYNLTKTKRIEEETAGDVTRLRINLRVGGNRKVRGAPPGKLVTGNENPATPRQKGRIESASKNQPVTAAPPPAPFAGNAGEFRCALWSDGTLVMEIPGHGPVELPPPLSQKLRDYVAHVDLAIEG